MFETQTIGVESCLPLAGLSSEEPLQGNVAEMCDSRRSGYLGNSLSDLPLTHTEVEMCGSRRGHHSGTSLSDLSLIHPEAVIASSRDLGWHNIRVLQMRQADSEMEVPPLENHCLIFQLEHQIRVNANIDGDYSDHCLSLGDIAIIPAGVPSHWRWRNCTSYDTLHLYLDPLFVQRTAEICDLNHGQIAIEPQLGIRDEQLSHIAMSLLYELKEENIVGRLYADSVASVLALQLVRRYSRLKDVRIIKGGMSPHKLRRAIELINDYLDHEEDAALTDVAKKVGMSYYHFSRAFKRSMGLSPINFIAQQRIERAKKLLAETELPIAEVALQAGFSSQSHFTKTFRRLAGITPGSFRKGM